MSSQTPSSPPAGEPGNSDDVAKPRLLNHVTLARGKTRNHKQIAKLE